MVIATTTPVYRGLNSPLHPKVTDPLTFRHRAGVSAIRRLAPSHAPVAFGKQSYPLVCATPKLPARGGFTIGVSLNRRNGSGLPSSLTRIRLIALVFSTDHQVSV